MRVQLVPHVIDSVLRIRRRKIGFVRVVHKLPALLHKIPDPLPRHILKRLGDRVTVALSDSPVPHADDAVLTVLISILVVILEPHVLIGRHLPVSEEIILVHPGHGVAPVRHLPAAVEPVPGAVLVQPSRVSAVPLQIVIPAVVLIVIPTQRHGAGGLLEVVILPVNLLPSGHRIAVPVKIVPAVVDQHPLLLRTDSSVHLKLPAVLRLHPGAAPGQGLRRTDRHIYKCENYPQPNGRNPPSQSALSPSGAFSGAVYALFYRRRL